jgi:hypothetical protein
MAKRVFCGKDDQEAVVVEKVFPNSPLVISSGINLHPDKNGIAIQGPHKHLDFIFPFLVQLLAIRPDSEKLGKWDGLDWFNKEWLSLYYSFGQSFADIFLLLEYKFRRDVCFFCNIKLNKKALIKVINNGEIVFNAQLSGLPEGLEKNGEIELPELPKIEPVSINISN